MSAPTPHSPTPPPPLLRTPAPHHTSTPPFLIFQIPSTLGEVIKIYLTFFKKGGGGGPNYVSVVYLA